MKRIKKNNKNETEEGKEELKEYRTKTDTKINK